MVLNNISLRVKSLTIAISIIAVALVPTLLSITSSAQPTGTGGAANSILISSAGKNYKCTSAPEAPPTLGIHVSANKQGGMLKGQWHIIGSEFGEKKGTITGGTLDKTKYDLKGKETIDTLCSGKVPKDITISGTCGANQKINFRIMAGSHEVFTGRAHCSELLF
jgi:hypothetical protein